MPHEIIDDENRVDIDDYATTLRHTQPALFVPPDIDNIGRDLVAAFTEQLQRIDDEIQAIHDARFPQSASGKRLDLIAAQYDVQRASGESDEKLRKRIRAARNAALSRGTYEDIARVALDVLDTTAGNITLRRPSDTKQDGGAIIAVKGSILDDAPFTNSEIANILGEAAVAGHRVTVEQSDSFTFGDPNNGWGSDWGQIIE